MYRKIYFLKMSSVLWTVLCIKGMEYNPTCNSSVMNDKKYHVDRLKEQYGDDVIGFITALKLHDTKDASWKAYIEQEQTVQYIISLYTPPLVKAIALSALGSDAARTVYEACKKKDPRLQHDICFFIDNSFKDNKDDKEISFYLLDFFDTVPCEHQQFIDIACNFPDRYRSTGKILYAYALKNSVGESSLTAKNLYWPQVESILEACSFIVKRGKYVLPSEDRECAFVLAVATMLDEIARINPEWHTLFEQLQYAKQIGVVIRRFTTVPLALCLSSSHKGARAWYQEMVRNNAESLAELLFLLVPLSKEQDHSFIKTIFDLINEIDNTHVSVLTEALLWHALREKNNALVSFLWEYPLSIEGKNLAHRYKNELTALVHNAPTETSEWRVLQERQYQQRVDNVCLKNMHMLSIRLLYLYYNTQNEIR